MYKSVNMVQLAFSKPAKLGRYRIDRELGRGAMGVVYLAFDPDIQRAVAIKTLRPNMLSSEEGREFVNRFKAEAQAVGRLMHQNIVAIYDFDLISDTPYFVMEYCEGKELKRLLGEKGQLDFKEAITLMIQVLDALEYSHQRGVVHRDIKPANIFILSTGEVKLADFGIAHVDTSNLTRVGTVLGTPSYMSPEQAGAESIDCRADLFSTAVVLYELVTGTKVFKGPTAASTIHQIIHKKPADLRVFNSDLPSALNQVLQRALSKKPTKRFKDAASFRAALLGILADAGPHSKLDNPFWFAFFRALVLGVFISSCLFFLWQFWGANSSGNSSGNSHTNYETQRKDFPYSLYPSGHSLNSIDKVSELFDPQEEKRIQRLLDVAGAHLKINRLVSPQGSNAYDTYRLVLDRDPNNQKAYAGLIAVAKAYVKRCDELFESGQRVQLEQYLLLGKRLFPSYSPLKNRLKQYEVEIN